MFQISTETHALSDFLLCDRHCFPILTKTGIYCHIIMGFVARQRLDKLVLLGNGYAYNNRGNVGGCAFYAVRVEVMYLGPVGACFCGL
jgi:hypothetical protein